MAEENVVRIKKTPTAMKVIRTISYVFLALTSLFIVGILTYYLLAMVGTKTDEIITKLEGNIVFKALFEKNIVYAVIILQLFFTLLLIFTGRQGVAFKVFMTIFYLALVGCFLFIMLPEFIEKFVKNNPLKLLPEAHTKSVSDLISKIGEANKPYLFIGGFGIGFIVALMMMIFFATKKPKTGSSILMMIALICAALIALVLAGAYAIDKFKNDWSPISNASVKRYFQFGVVGVPLLYHLIFSTAGLIGLFECKKN